MDEPHDPRIRDASNDRELAEVLVEDREDPSFGARTGKNFVVSRIVVSAASPLDIMARSHPLDDRVACLWRILSLENPPRLACQRRYSREASINLSP
jgi:hypothetical protein